VANTQAMTTSFKTDLLNGIHAFGTSVVRASTVKDVFKAALYVDTATINAATTAYSTTNEVTGTNYVAGGVTVTTSTVPASSGTTSFVTPSASIVYTNVTLSTSFDCVLLYNSTATGKNAVSVHTFTTQTITAGTLTLTMPTNNSTTGLIRLA
jgi:hypothetical protein